MGKGKHELRGIKKEARTKVIAEKGEIPVSLALRKRVATFSNGVAVGDEDFVKRMAGHYRQVMGRKQKRVPRTMGEGRWEKEREASSSCGNRPCEIPE